MRHIRKELVEIEADRGDVIEWADLLMLVVDGAFRSGHEPQTLIDAFGSKLTINEGRTWPDWRTVDTQEAIEHVRTGEDLLAKTSPAFREYIRDSQWGEDPSPVPLSEEALDRNARVCKHLGIGLPGCPTCDPRASRKGDLPTLLGDHFRRRLDSGE
jgi:hypothetical protein